MVRPGGSAMYLLSVKHMLQGPNTNLTQPWSPREVGGTVAVSANFDAGVAEVQSPEAPDFNLPTPAFHCFGPTAIALDPIIGMAVKKSAAATGITNSTIVGLFALNPAQPGNADILFHGIATNPGPVPPGLVRLPYLSGGDSGSVSLLGHSFNLADFGTPINDAISAFITSLPPRHQVIVWFLIVSYLRNAVVGLNYAGGGRLWPTNRHRTSDQTSAC